MISFTEINSIDEVGGVIADCPEEIIHEVLAPLVESADGGYSVAVSVACGCLLVRICEGGEYAFLFPFEICEGADIAKALVQLAAYVTYQEIGFTLLDIPAELRYIVDELGFSRVEYETADEDGDSFIAEIMTECGALDAPPTVKGERLTLGSLDAKDAAAYAEICRDAELNKYWGYDYLTDVGESDDGYFIAEAEREFSLGTALTLAVRDGNRLVGDAVIYGYDFFGNAAVGVRIAREYQGRGYGRESSELVFSLAKDMGLKCIRAVIMNENIPSISLYSSMMKKVRESDGRSYFEKHF